MIPVSYTHLIPAHEELAEDTVFYEAVEAMDTVPENVPITVTDERTGQQTERRVPLSGYTFSDRRWEDGFEFRVVFHEYGTPGYHLGLSLIHIWAPDVMSWWNKIPRRAMCAPNPLRLRSIPIR